LICKILLQLLILFNNAFECNRDFSASFYELFSQQFIFDTGVFESLQHRVFFVYALYFSVFDFIKHVGAILIITCEGFIFKFIIFYIDDLLQMKNVIYSLKDVSD